MYQKYKNQEIYKRLRLAKRLALISLIMSILTIISYVILYEILHFPFAGIEHSQVTTRFVYIFSLSSMSGLLDIVIYCKPSGGKGNKEWNDCDPYPRSILMCPLLPALMTISMLIIYGIIALAGGGTVGNNIMLMFGELGYTLPARLFLYGEAAAVYNARNLIKEEWKDDPPAFIRKMDEERDREQEEKTRKLCQGLIEESGARFFIKYYRQIKALPLRDVDISENYSSAEREERLSAAKQIIDLGLSELALMEILEQYGTMLGSEEVEQANALLKEICRSGRTKDGDPQTKIPTEKNPSDRFVKKP